MDSELEKRTWYYTLPPSAYEITCTKCGGSHLWWSEYRDHIWCYDCEIDFNPEYGPHAGVFCGPIPIQVSYMVGLVFDRFNMETGKIEIYNIETNKYEEYDSIVVKMAKDTLVGNIKDPYGFWIAEEGKKNLSCGLYALVAEVRSHYKEF